MKYEWDVIGHNKEIAYLQKIIENGKISHAYLINGSKESGKLSLAFGFIYSIYCTSVDAKRPCNKCVNCQKIKKGVFPDFLHIKKLDLPAGKAGKKKNISIEQIRTVIKTLNQTSGAGNYKICLIENAESLSLGAANALLKTLEEPKGKTIMILLTEKETLPATIKSRCHSINLKPVSTKDIYDYVFASKEDRDLAQIISHLSKNKPEITKALLKSNKKITAFTEEVEKISAIIEAPDSKKIKLTEKLIKSIRFENKEKLITNLNIWQSVFRDALLIKNSHPELIVNINSERNITSISKKLQNNQLGNSILKITKIKKLLEQNVNAKLLIENFLLDI
ncbi:MAG: DNA polymerase III subunit [Patescibacteria group bacterium]